MHHSVADALQCRSFIPVQLFLDTSETKVVLALRNAVLVMLMSARADYEKKPERAE